LNGRIIGTGALQRLDETTGEIKRVWLLPEYQGQGLGYQMMARLIETAREKGYASASKLARHCSNEHFLLQKVGGLRDSAIRL
jgi:N-acetylglutamate synthase-like GNAT family acetyltransferase